MLDDKALQNIAAQLGTLAMNHVSLERDIEVQQETIKSQDKELTTVREELRVALEQRDGLQREVYSLQYLDAATNTVRPLHSGD